MQINDEIKQLKNEILSEIHHRILIQFTGVPKLKDEQLFFMLLPFFQGKPMDSVMRKCVAAVGIVHASIEEHEKIKEHSEEDKEQQLTVLSGDYYSGRYYEILSHIGDIALIRNISLGIIARCEQQIKLYEHEPMSITEWITYIQTIESELIKQFFSTIGEDRLSKIAEKALLIVRIKELLEEEELSYIGKKMREEGITRSQLEESIDRAKQNLLILLNESSLEKELIHWIEENCLI